MLMEMVTIVTLSLKQWVVISLLSMSRSSPVIDSQRNFEGMKKREQDQMRKEFSNRKDTKCGTAIGGSYTELTVKNHVRSNFPYQRPLSGERLMQKIKSRRLFGYV